MTEHNKLARDKIPEIVISNGETPHFHVIDNDDEYLSALLQKDIEESAELAETPNLEELADKLEVIYAIAKAIGHTPEQVEEARAEKHAKRGGFDDRIFLESTE